MINIYDKVYFKLREKEVHKAKVIIKRLDIEEVNKRISKICWSSGIEYEIILKNSEILLLLLKGNKDKVLLKFEKKDMVFLEEFDSYLNFFYKYSANKGVYITTGVFEEKIKNRCSIISIYKKIKLVDKYNLIKDQLGIKGKATDEIKGGKLNLYKYLPN
ncbi:hypothetical protein [Clostridium lundense]|uniref:hypothetical protein n=1 Tax=Clostridium lundense TaxID=319475 RepID=UPI00047F7286|nr:hypothetical protein [Clostridium lundense]